MTGYRLDTHVIAETMRSLLHGHVVTFLTELDIPKAQLCAVARVRTEKENYKMSRRHCLHHTQEASALTTQDIAGTEQAPYIVLFLQFYPEEDQWIGDCEALGVMSCGDTLDEAKNSLDSLIEITLNSWEDDGERDRIFQEKHIRVYSGPVERQEIEYPRLVPHHLVEMSVQPATAA